jgi:hypothetical protein
MLSRVGEEAFEILLDELVKDGVRRPAREVRRREDGHEKPSRFACRVPTRPSAILRTCVPLRVSPTVLAVAADSSEPPKAFLSLVSR